MFGRKPKNPLDLSNKVGNERSLPHIVRFGLANDRSTPLVLQLEPWAYDYTAAPGQRLELVIASAVPDTWLNMVENADGTVQVYIEGEGPQVGLAWDVFLEGERIEIGHNRDLWARPS